MNTEFTITAENPVRILRDRQLKDSAITYTFDFSAWAEQFGDLTDVTWSVSSGSASVSNEDLDENIATALVSYTEAGTNLLKITAETGSNTCVAYLEVKVTDPLSDAVNDYGM